MRNIFFILIPLFFFQITDCQKEIKSSTILIYSDPDQVKIKIPELKLKVKKDSSLYTVNDLKTGQYTISMMSEGIDLSLSLVISDPDTFIVYANFISSQIIGITKREFEEYNKKHPLNTSEPELPNKMTSDSSKVFYLVADMPLFNGGDPATEFRKFIQENLRYPLKAAEQGICGRVIVQFIIDENGKLINPVIIAPVHPLLDAEALRVVNESPLWSPGKHKGENVKVIYTFPIMFIIK